MFGRATIRLGIGPHSSLSWLRRISMTALVHEKRMAVGLP